MGYLSCRTESAVSTSTSLSPPSSSSAHKPEKTIKIQHFPYSDLEAATNGFSDQKLLGKGSHGHVYKAVLRGRPVAIKKGKLLPQPNSSSSAPEIANEIDVLSKIQSPNLVNLVGFAYDSNDTLLVVEFMSNGTLYDVLHSSTSKPPNWGRRIRLALQTAKAIDTLHSSTPPVIHRDIKSANVLIDRNYNARLGDFGLALRGHVDDSSLKFKSTPPAGTMGYLDPYYVTPDCLSTKSDVFSFGILLLEIISGRKAIDVTHSPPSIVDWAIPLIKKGKLLAVYDPRILPLKDMFVRKQLAVIAAKCVRSCRERRPSMKEIVGWLSGLCKLVPLHPWINGLNLNNPCMMVETMGIPVEARNAHVSSRTELDGFDGRVCKSAMRSSGRVFSDLGFSSNLMDLMATTNTEEEEECVKAYSSRFGSGRYFFRGRNNLYRACGTEKDAFGLSMSQIVGGRSNGYSKEDEISGSNLNSQ